MTGAPSIEAISDSPIPGIFIAEAQQSEPFVVPGSQQNPRTESKPGSANATSANHATPARTDRPHQPLRNGNSRRITINYPTQTLCPVP